MNTRLNHIQNWIELVEETNWSVAALAKKCHVSVRTLERHFLKTMGQNPKSWLKQVRQKRATILLQRGFSVKEIASRLGYKHAQHFSREYKWYWGYSPTTPISTRCRL